MADFPTRLVELRKSRGFTQKQFSEIIGITEVGLQNYEGRRRKPAFDVLINIADAFNVSLDYLVGRSDDPTRR